MNDDTPQGKALADIPLTPEYLETLAGMRSPARPRLQCDGCEATRDGNLYASGVRHLLCPARGTFRRRP